MHLPRETGRRLREQDDGLNESKGFTMNDINKFDGGTVSPFDSIRQRRPDSSEYWSGREMMPLLGYRKWQDFTNAIERAKNAISAQGSVVTHHFMDAHKVSTSGPAQRDVELTRFAAYQVAMCGDPRKPEVAAALAYFAIRTREAETRPAAPSLQGPELLAAAFIESQRVLEQRDARIHQLETQASTDAPKVAYVDMYVADSDLLSFSTVASTCEITEKALRELLIRKDWVYVQTDSRWSEGKGRKVERRRYSEKADKKRYFRRVETHDAPRFRGSELMHTLKVTPQGAEAIARLVAKEMAA